MRAQSGRLSSTVHLTDPPARDGWLQLRERSAAARDPVWQPVPHPSPQNLNTRAGAKDEILAGLRLAARAVADS